MRPELFELNHQVESIHWWFVARRRIIRTLIQDVVSPSKESVLIDVGCGTGGNIGALGEDYKCFGIDPSTRAIELASTRFPNVEFKCGKNPNDLGNIVQDATLIMLNDVLEHVQDDQRVLSTWVRAVRPGAYFLLTVPADMSLWSAHDETHGHYRRYDAIGFSQLWGHLPVSVLLESYFNTRLYPFVKMVRFLRRLSTQRENDIGVDLQLPPRPINRLLTDVFSGESRVLKRILRGEGRLKYSFGVSLVALLQKDTYKV